MLGDDGEVSFHFFLEGGGGGIGSGIVNAGGLGGENSRMSSGVSGSSDKSFPRVFTNGSVITT